MPEIVKPAAPEAKKESVPAEKTGDKEAKKAASPAKAPIEPEKKATEQDNKTGKDKK